MKLIKKIKQLLNRKYLKYLELERIEAQELRKAMEEQDHVTK